MCFTVELSLYKILRLCQVLHKSHVKILKILGLFYVMFISCPSDFMHVIQDYWSFGSMQEFLGRVHLLQPDGLLPSHSIQLIHLLSVFREQMQNMLWTSTFDIFELFCLIVRNCCLEGHMFTYICCHLPVGNVTKCNQQVVMDFSITCKFL